MPSGLPQNGHVRVAAVGDLHFGRNSQGTFQSLFTQVNQAAEVLVLCGDFTDYGTPDEARGLVREIVAFLRIAMVAVLGNHDYHGGHVTEITEHPPGCRGHRARRRRARGARRRLRRGEGLWRRLRRPRARAVGGRHVQALRPRGRRGSAEARGCARPPAHALARRGAALRADSRHRRGGTARDLPVPRLEPARRADQPLRRVGRRARPRAPRAARGAHRHRRARLQREPAAHEDADAGAALQAARPSR